MDVQREDKADVETKPNRRKSFLSTQQSRKKLLSVTKLLVLTTSTGPIKKRDQESRGGTIDRLERFGGLRARNQSWKISRNLKEQLPDDDQPIPLKGRREDRARCEVTQTWQPRTCPTWEQTWCSTTWTYTIAKHNLRTLAKRLRTPSSAILSNWLCKRHA